MRGLTPQDFKEVNGEAAMAWVNAENAKTQMAFDVTAECKALTEQCLKIMGSKDKLAYPHFSEDGLSFRNFWTDTDNPKGVWRITDRQSYYSENPNWTVLLDIDALAKQEERNWVYAGVINEEFNQKNFCMVQLSDGGSDATIAREFDIDTKTFVPNGFFLPESKMSLEWYDDSLLVSTHFEEGSMTDAGYPATIRLLKRGQSLQEAQLLFRVDQSHMRACSTKIKSGDHTYLLFQDYVDFYTTKNYLVAPHDLLTQHLLPVPEDAELNDIFIDTALFQLRSDWQVGDRIFKANSLVGFHLEKFIQNPDNDISNLVTLWFEPPAGCAIECAVSNKKVVLVSLLKNVSSELYEITRTETGLQTHRIPLACNGDIDVITLCDKTSEIILSYTSFTEPTTLYSYDTDTKKLEKIKQAPSRFDAEKYQTQQCWATSKDGTPVPYFMVAKRDIVYDGANPVLMTGYGGFEVSNTPHYLGLDGVCLLEKDIIYVQANIRGGGEFGKAWYEGGSGKNKQNCFDDFIAIAEDLIHKKITCPRYLGIEGGSNGGLLVAACAVQRPNLFNAVLCEVPLLDMLCYHTLLAGNSWIAEYGDPDDPAMRAVIEKYSPLHNLKPDQIYPLMFISTSTKDDRVHPYHARMMAYALQQLGKPVFYFEDIDGGHSAGADLTKAATNYARSYVYLYQQILAPTLQKQLNEANLFGLSHKKARTEQREETAIQYKFGT